MHRKSRNGASLRVRTVGWRLGVILLLACGMIACGGGGDGGSSTTPGSSPPPSGSASAPSGVFGTAVALRFADDMAERQGRATKVQARVLAVDAAGNARDVTDQVSAQVDLPQLLTVAHEPGRLNLAFSTLTGPVTLRIQAMGLSLDKAFWITQVPTADVSTIRVTLADGFAPVIPNADGSYSFLYGRAIRLNVLVTVPGMGEQDITSEVEFSSSSPANVALEPALSEAGEVTWVDAYTLRHGDSEISMSWIRSRLSKVLHVASGLVVQGSYAQQDALTENAAGRLTAYLHGAALIDHQQTAYIESAGDNNWGPLVFLDPPPTVLPILTGARAAESPNGYRALVASNSVSDSWIYLIGPGGELQGPVVLNSGWAATSEVLQVAVTPDGNGHVWMLDRARAAVVRQEVRFVDGALATRSSLPLSSSGNISLQVSVAPSGTVGIAWADANCGVHYAFDVLQTPVTSGLTDASVPVTDCRPYFSQIYTAFKMAAASDELALVIRYGTDFDAVTTELVTARRGAGATVTTLDRDASGTAGTPQIGANDNGELVAFWATVTRGMWAVHRPANAQPGAPFLVQSPSSGLATPMVERVLSRGDGRFVLVWRGADIGRDTPLLLREFSARTGLGDKLHFPYQNSLATNSSTLIATPFGISAIWSFANTGGNEVDLMQGSLP